MPVQDDAREREMRSLFNLTADPDRKRSEIDAYLMVDGRKVNFELKSSTGSSVSTVRDFGPDHISKWRDGLHWIFAFYDKSGDTLKYCIYASPADMESWIAEKEKYIAPDVALAADLPSFVSAAQVKASLGDKIIYSRADARSIMKNQWSTDDYAANEDRVAGYTRERMAEILTHSRDSGVEAATIEHVVALFGAKDVYSIDDARSLMKRRWTKTEYVARQDVESGYSLERMTEILQARARYVLGRGSTLNNPHIEAKFFEKFDRIEAEHAGKLRELIRDYLKASATEDATA
ncbi:hypothetical protein [Microbacterium sp. BH-3-3-3]|uniref:hypothetical protein n=1 Tax=Microbacterium sp. BH-3-3-3 TaxID=1906742 RepID=UPI0011A75620|nr:hypothetical protein [Microbacterium sp. BH-3-3-3]